MYNNFDVFDWKAVVKGTVISVNITGLKTVCLSVGIDPSLAGS